MVDRRWLFICSCIALVTSAFTFVVRGDVLQELGNFYELTQQQRGAIEGAVFLGMALSMVVGGLVCDALGMKTILFLAFLAHLAGSLGTIFCPKGPGAYLWLYSSSMLMGFGNGLTEVAVNPLVATLYAKEKTHYLNMLHAWWPGGLVIGGVGASVVMRSLFPSGVAGLELWQASLMLIVIPAIIYGLMLLPAKFPATERVESGVTTADMFKECLRPLFIIWGVCMLMTASTELGPQKWQESVMRSTAGIPGTLILVYTSGMMFVLRHFAGPIAHAISPVGMMIGSSVLSAAGLYLLSYANDATTAVLYATIYGLGVAFFWPTMLGVTAERFPRGGALALALMGSIGNLSIAYVLPAMGGIVDNTSVAELRSLDGQLKTATAAADGGSAELYSQLNGRLFGLQMSADDWKAVYGAGGAGSPIEAAINKDGNALDAGAVGGLFNKAVGTLQVLAKANPELAKSFVNSPEVAAKLATASAAELHEPLSTRSAFNAEKINAAAATDPTAATFKRELAAYRLVSSAQATGFSTAFRWVSVLPCVLVVIFTAIFLYDLSRGGYKPEILISQREENELMAGGVPAAVE